MMISPFKNSPTCSTHTVTYVTLSNLNTVMTSLWKMDFHLSPRKMSVNDLERTGKKIFVQFSEIFNICLVFSCTNSRDALYLCCSKPLKDAPRATGAPVWTPVTDGP